MSKFNQELWDKTDIVFKHSHERRKEIQEFISILGKRIDIQEAYAKGLEDNAKLCEKIKQGEDDIPEYAFTSLRQDGANRSAQTRTFVKSLKQQILLPLKDVVASQYQQTKQLQKDWKKMDKQLHELRNNITKCKSRYDEQYNDYEQIFMNNEIALQSQKVAKDKRGKVISKSLELLKLLGELQRNYERAVNDYNSYLNQYYVELDKMLELLQKQQQVRLSRQQENILKILIFETSMMKNFEYDITSITKHTQKIKKHDTIQQFIDKNKTGKERDQNLHKHLRKNMLGQTIYRTINKDIQKKINYQTNVKFKEFVQKKFKDEDITDIEVSIFKKQQLDEFHKMFKMISSVWKGSQKLTGQFKNDLEVLFKDQFNRLAASMYFHQYQLSFNVIIPNESYAEIVALISLLLNICQQTQDVHVARKITNLSFCFYSNFTQNDRKYLHLKLNDTKLFALEDYWKASVFQTAQQQLLLHFGQKVDQQVEMRYMSLVLGQLAMFCHQMILLGVSSKEVRQTIGWFCRLYQIPDDQNRDLARTVNASMKRYKDLFPPIIIQPKQEVRRISFDIGGTKTNQNKQQQPKTIEQVVTKQQTKQVNPQTQEINKITVSVEQSNSKHNQLSEQINEQNKVNQQLPKQKQQNSI